MCGCQRATGAMLLVRRELRCGAKLDAAEKLMLLVLRGRSESRSCPPSRGSSVGSGDRLPTAKQMAAMAGAISGAKVSSGQCLRGFAAETWRENAHGRRPKLGAWSCGRAAGMAARALSGRIWRKLQGGPRELAAGRRAGRLRRSWRNREAAFGEASSQCRHTGVVCREAGFSGMLERHAGRQRSR